MNSIADTFSCKKALIPLIIGGDPDIATTEKLILALAKAGADMVEIGVPFSDPVAEGFVVQEAQARALASGCTVDRLFAMFKRLRCQINIPLLLMTYINPVYIYGKERFIAECRQSGIAGIIIPDLPFEEKEELEDVCNHQHIRLISMVATTSGERITKIIQNAKDFLYCVSSPGKASVITENGTDITGLIRRAKKLTDLPCVVESDLRTTARAREIISIADGIILSSAVVELVATHGAESVEVAMQYIREMKLEMRR